MLVSTLAAVEVVGPSSTELAAATLVVEVSSVMLVVVGVLRIGAVVGMLLEDVVDGGVGVVVVGVVVVGLVVVSLGRLPRSPSSLGRVVVSTCVVSLPSGRSEDDVIRLVRIESRGVVVVVVESVVDSGIIGIDEFVTIRFICRGK